MPNNWNEYIRDLEMDVDESRDSNEEEGVDDDDDGNNDKSRFIFDYRTRARIGRGGRVVMDRVPIYRRSHQNNNVKYIYPTSLSPPNISERIQQPVKGNATITCVN